MKLRAPQYGCDLVQSHEGIGHSVPFDQLQFGLNQFNVLLVLWFFALQKFAE